MRSLREGEGQVVSKREEKQKRGESVMVRVVKKQERQDKSLSQRAIFDRFTLRGQKSRNHFPFSCPPRRRGPRHNNIEGYNGVTKRAEFQTIFTTSEIPPTDKEDTAPICSQSLESSYSLARPVLVESRKPLLNGIGQP